MELPVQLRPVVLISLACFLAWQCKPANTSGLKEAVASDGGGCYDQNTNHNTAACDEAFKNKMLAEFDKDRQPTYEGNGAERGQWSDPIHTPGNQAVHMIVLPSGRVVIYNGSSNRLALSGGKDGDTDHKAPWLYDNWGVFDPRSQKFQLKRHSTIKVGKDGKISYPPYANAPLKGDALEWKVNGKTQSLEVTEGNWNKPEHNMDLFCGNKSHLPDGDFMFIGGSNTYNPFRGARSAWHFDWEREEFDKRYLIGDGHWYPSILTLGDGKIVSLAGFGMNNSDNIFEDKFFAPEPDGFDQLNPKKVLPHLERSKKETVASASWVMEVYDPKSDQWYFQSLADVPVDGLDSTFGEALSRFDNFPRANLMPSGNEIMLSGDGASPGKRTVANRHLIFIKVDVGQGGLKVSMRAQLNARCFADQAGAGGEAESEGEDELNPCEEGGDTTVVQHGDGSTPEKSKQKFMARTTNYQSFAIDPRTNNNDFLIIGGHYGSNVSFALEDTATPMEHTSADFLSFKMPQGGNGRVKLTLEENLMGNRWKTAEYCAKNPDACPINPKLCDNPGPRENQCDEGKKTMTAPYRNLDGRVMHLATILPTQEILVMGGANLSYRGPRMHPQLFTPNAKGSWDVTEMAAQSLPRTYHTSSVLLPDGRVLLGGGNNGLARVKMDDLQGIDPKNPATWGADKVPLAQRPGLEDLPDEVAGAAKGMPMEVHWLEIFTPPYLLKGGARPEIKGVSSGGRKVANGTPKSKDDLAKLSLGQNVEIDVANGGSAGNAKVTLVKLGAVTHSGDAGQRLFKLCGPGEGPGPCKGAGGGVSAKMPGTAQRNALPAGVYMMFYVDGRGVPSVSQMVQVL